MQLTRVDVYNLALGKIKIGKRVTSLNDEAVRRYMLPQVYELVFASLLERHPWSFATKTDKLGRTAERAEVTLPNAAYRFAWVYPHDCRKVLAIGEYDERLAPGCGERRFDFSRHFPSDIAMGPANGRVILTVHDHACIRYLSNDIPEGLWPAGFVQAMTWAMASEITRAENASDSDADYRMQQAQGAFEAARRADVHQKS